MKNNIVWYLNPITLKISKETDDSENLLENNSFKTRTEARNAKTDILKNNKQAIKHGTTNVTINKNLFNDLSRFSIADMTKRRYKVNIERLYVEATAILKEGKNFDILIRDGLIFEKEADAYEKIISILKNQKYELENKLRKLGL